MTVTENSRFAQVLSDELEALRELAGSQQAARQAIAANRIDELSALTSRTEELASRVIMLERGRCALLSDSLGNPATFEGGPGVLAGAGLARPASTSDAQMREIGMAVQHLRELNTQNAMLLGSCLLMVQGELNMLSTLGGGVRQYTPSGRAAGRIESGVAEVDCRA